VTVVADLSGEPLAAAVAGGVAVLKVSHEDLIADGRADAPDVPALLPAMHELALGARCVVVSRAAEPSLALVDGRLLHIVVPPLTQVEHRGAGDSMTAGIAAGLAGGASMIDALRTGAAAGALNVTRRGLATGHRQAVELLTERVVVRAQD
jgi:1-phosphofructokinase